MSIVSRTPLLLVAATLSVLLALAIGMYFYDHSRHEHIAHGVQIDGVDVSGLRLAAARQKIQRALIDPLNRPVIVRSGSHTWTITARAAGLTVDTTALVNQALDASHQGSIITRTFRNVFGSSIHRNIPLHVSYSHAAIRSLTARVRQAVNRPARDASVTPDHGELKQVAGTDGMLVDNPRLANRVQTALTTASASRTVTVPAHIVTPAVSTNQLASKYPAYIVVSRGSFSLRLYQHLKLTRTYPIAVGMQGLETPAGLYKIQWKQVDPPWMVPNSAWAGKLAGKTIPPGPQDPLKARFMSFDGGAGIHGIDPSEYSSIGHNASHGCVRMRIPDVIALYDRTPVGTPVYIA
ncbi:MAG TPA: L,D-transpeptidase/peptidoglycan binding protein [Solirubrobacteraceae bacterium]|nr:L,D-transpeptidase/peptidoglycan binding protein [Solirubrobacteraceae bacterium]